MVNREELEKKLDRYFEKYSGKTKMVEDFCELITKNHNYLYGDAMAVFYGTEPLSGLSDEVLFWFAHLAENYSIKADLDVKNYFSELEIEQYSKSQANNSTSVLPIEFSVFPVGSKNDQWVGVLNADKLYELYESGIIFYNIETQRNPIVRYNKAGEESLDININEKSVNSIRSLMRKSLFIPNALTLNLRADDDDNLLDYDEHNGVLIIKSGKLDIIDGYHRYQAIIREKMADPTFQIEMIVNFTNFDTNTAKRFIAQEDKRNKLNSNYAKSLDDTRFGTTVVSKMNSDINFYLNGKFKPYKTGGHDLTIGRASDAVDDAFVIHDLREANKVKAYLVDGINEIIEVNDHLIHNDTSMRLAIYALALFNKMDEEEKIKKSCNVLKEFDTKYRYDANKAYSTVKKIMLSL